MDEDNKLYDLLGVARNATDVEIKKVSEEHVVKLEE
jgi:curved DNA-binding protein CbpA